MILRIILNAPSVVSCSTPQTSAVAVKETLERFHLMGFRVLFFEIRCCLVGCHQFLWNLWSSCGLPIIPVGFCRRLVGVVPFLSWLWP
jgi:hypothetical protein